MKFKQVLLTSTAMLMLGTPVAPLFAQSQAETIQVAQAAPPALAGAIQTYLDAQAAVATAQSEGGDVAAAESAFAAAEAELGALCSAIGQADIAACIATFEAGGLTAAPEAEAEVEAEAPAEEPAAVEEPSVPEPAPAEDPVEAEQPVSAEEPAPAEEPAAVEEPAPVPEAPVEDVAPVEAPPIEDPAPVEADEPAEEPAPVEAEAPAEQPDAEEAPAADEQPIDEPGASEQPADETAVEGEAAQEPTAPESDAPAPLLEAVAAYEAAVADFDAAMAAGADAEASAEAVDAAEAELSAICGALGQADVAACLAGFEIELDIIDVQAELDAGGSLETEAPAQPETPVEGETEAAVETDDDIMLEGDVQGEIVPEGTDASEVAPLLDSAKDAAAGVLEDEAPVAAEGEGELQADVEAEAPAPTEEPAAPVEFNVDEIPAIDEEEAQNRQEISIEEIEQAAASAETATLNQAPGQQRAGQQGGVLVGPVREGPSNAEIVATIGLATIFAIGANQFIDTPDTPRIIYPDDREYYYEELTDGRTREVILRADGSRIVTVRDRYGDVTRRSRIEPDGREILLVYVDPTYTRYDEQGRWIDPGRQLPPLVLNIPPREYVLDASAADQQQVAQFLDQPPVESIQRYYTIDEVKRSARLRDMVRRLEIGDLTFETASANISQSEINTLSAVANAMLALIEQNPAETFLIEGHTDAVGSDLSNLALSDRRAEAVAYALTRVYGIPAENLATQGYGERYLKVNTQADERTNRRVTVRRITPLVTPMVTAAAG